MFVKTIRAHELSAIEAVVHLRVGCAALVTSNTTCITNLSKSEKTQQTFMEEAVRQTVEAISFW